MEFKGINWQHAVWGSPDSWSQANRTIRHLLAIHGTRLGVVVRTADRIRQYMADLEPFLEGLCNRTCRFCPDACCLGARVWYDYRDLVFLHITRQSIPAAQPQIPRNAVCRFLGVRGCRIERLKRPWICTRYLCPTQTTRLRRRAPDRLDWFSEMIRVIKHARIGMEKDFIGIQMRGRPKPG